MMAPRARLAWALWTAGAIALVLGVRLLILQTVTWPTPEPWENGVPFIVEEVVPVESGTIVSLGGRPIGRVTVEIEPTTRHGWHPRRELRELTVMRIDRSMKIARDSRFRLRFFDGKPIISMTAGRESSLSA